MLSCPLQNIRVQSGYFCNGQEYQIWIIIIMNKKYKVCHQCTPSQTRQDLSEGRSRSGGQHKGAIQQSARTRSATPWPWNNGPSDRCPPGYENPGSAPAEWQIHNRKWERVGNFERNYIPQISLKWKTLGCDQWADLSWYCFTYFSSATAYDDFRYLQDTLGTKCKIRTKNQKWEWKVICCWLSSPTQIGKFCDTGV